MADSKTKQYRVRVGQSIKHGTRGTDGERISKTYKGGDAIDLTEDEAKRLEALGAIDSGERRKGRDGQTTRLQRKIDEQQAEIDRLKAMLDAPKPEDDPGREEAIESIRARGDNFTERGETDPTRVAAHTVEAVETARDLESLRDETGLGGMARSKAPAAEPATAATGSASKPSEGAGGNTQSGGKK